MRKLPATVLLAAACLAAVPSPALPLPPIPAAWKWTGKAEGAVVSGGTVVVRNAAGLTALDADTGEERWSAAETRDVNGRGAGPLDLGGSVAAAFGTTVVVRETGSGRLVARVVLEGHVEALAGPPLVAVVEREGKRESQLVAIDAASGAVVGEGTAGGTVLRARVRDGLLLLELANGHDGEVTVLDLPTFVPLWSLNGLVLVNALLDGTLVCWSVDGDSVVARRLDLRTGPGGDPLPQPPPDDSSGLILPWDLTWLEGDDGSVDLRRADLATRTARWEAHLPGQPLAYAADEKRLYFVCQSGTNGALAVLDREDGKVVRVVAAPDQIAELLPAGRLVVARTAGGGLLAFDPLAEAGPAPSLEKQVDELLARAALRYDSGGLIQRALRELGPDALPIVLARFPALPPLAVPVAARLFVETRFRAAAPALAARLPDAMESARASTLSGASLEEVLRALSYLGSDRQVPAVIAVLEDETLGALRLHALAALAGIASPAARAEIRAALASRPPATGSWYRPPRAPKQGADTLLPDGSLARVFLDDALGNPADLWVAVRPKGEEAFGEARFLGYTLAQDPLGASPAIAASFRDGRLDLTADGERTPFFSTELDGLARDTDGDGIPDLVERRLFLDPKSADTDGDGIPDGRDPAPNARVREARGEAQEIALAVFDQMERFAPRRPRPPLLVAFDAALEWPARDGAAITISPRELAEGPPESPLHGASSVLLAAGDPDDPPEGLDERVFWYGGIRIVVRLLDRRWVIRDVRQVVVW